MPETDAARTDAAHEIALPDGRRIVAPDPDQAAVLWREVTGNDLYARGVEGLAAGDVVFDVGGNLGLAALFFSDLVPGLRVYSFEPAEDCFACLRENTRRHGTGITAVQVAVGSRPGTGELTYYPRSPAQSSLYPDEDEDRRHLMTYLANTGIDEDTARALGETMYQGRRYQVDVTTVTAAMAEHGVDEIALLKIDVERAEQDVLDGIEESDWPRIRRVVAEVHDRNGRLAAVVEGLTRRGFTVRVGQEEMLTGTGVQMVLALRDR
ncbi:FkbM family methyltransferase [Streptomyces sp. AGS-58]|uniref:FkbM family methyltransferase n=1 Tax=unclassified Streptomyces TaxID=2593676 RepID=UPI0035A37D2F